MLRPGGAAAFAVWDVPEKARLVGVLGDAIERAGADRDAGRPAGPDGTDLSRDDAFRSLLAGAGLEDAAVSSVAIEVTIETRDRLWHGLLNGSVRASSSVLCQSDDVRQRIRVVFDEIVSEYARADGSLLLPAVVKICAANWGSPHPRRGPRDR